MIRQFALIAVCFCAPAIADEPARSWDFYLGTPGTYKVQIEHQVKGAAPGTKVKYAITLGNETQARELDLIANRPFVPLVIDLRKPERLGVVITGLSEATLRRTRVYAYDASSLPAGELYDPKKGIESKEVKTVRAILRQPPEEIDLAKAKLTIDRLIDPAIDAGGSLKKIDLMVARIRAMPGFGASPMSRLDALRQYIYVPGPWNDFRPFQYDLNDPLGKDIRSKLLPTYLSSKKGNCVSMPFLFIILGQRLGLNVTASSAPSHVLVKFRNETGTWINLEATSGANPARDAWIRQGFAMTDEALANGVYLQPLSKKETVALMASTLTEHLVQQHQYEKVLALSDVMLEHYPKDASSMVRKGAVYGRIANTQFIAKYRSLSQIPENQRAYFAHVSLNNRTWYAKAEALGWREESKEGQEKYLETIRRVQEGKATN